MQINNIGVVGIGVIGSGVVHALAQRGHRVVAVDSSEKMLASAKESINSNSFLYQLYMKKDSVRLSGQELMDGITFTTDYAKLESCSFIIENVTENWDIKEQVHNKINEIVGNDTIVAVNSSCISITKIGALGNRADKVIGMHFMNPVPIMPEVEVIKGFYTSEHTIASSTQLLTQMDKKGIIVKNSPGFVSNRVMTFMINEAIYLVYEDVADIESIDRLFRTCYGHKMGPLETCDLIGVDTILNSMIVLYESFNDSKYRPCPLLQEMVVAGHLGRKSGQGFYKY